MVHKWSINMSKQIQIRVYPDGRIESKTLGIKGKSCLNHIKEVENLTGSKTVKSEFTKEYYENESVQNTTYNEGYQQSGY